MIIPAALFLLYQNHHSQNIEMLFTLFGIPVIWLNAIEWTEPNTIDNLIGLWKNGGNKNEDLP